MFISNVKFSILIKKSVATVSHFELHWSIGFIFPSLSLLPTPGRLEFTSDMQIFQSVNFDILLILQFLSRQVVICLFRDISLSILALKQTAINFHSGCSPVVDSHTNSYKIIRLLGNLMVYCFHQRVTFSDSLPKLGQILRVSSLKQFN